MVIRNHYSTTDPDHKVEFREAITITISLLVKRIEDEDRIVRLAILEAVDELADHGE